MDFLSNAEPLLRIIWYIAIGTSVFFIIQSIMTFAGMDAHDGVDADFSGHLDGVDAPFQLFSLRNLVNFFMGFSWSAIAFYNIIGSKFLLLTLAVLIGLAFVAMFFVIIKQIQKLAEDNSFRIENTVNKTCSVYIPIPANKSGSGKVQVSVKGAFHELTAVTLDDRIETGTIVRIVAIESENIVRVVKA